MSASSIINVSRRYPSNGFFRWKPMIARFSHSSSQKIAGNPAVVLVQAVAFPPVVELAGGDVEPPDEPPGADLGLLRPAPDEIHDLVPRIMRNPDAGQSPQAPFLRDVLRHQFRQDLILGPDLLLQVVDPFLLG
jgi:hypothetical protein